MRPSLIFGLLLSALLVSGEAAAGKSSYTSSSTIAYNGVTYSYSSSSTCPDGTAALRLYRKWWCAVTTTSSSTASSSTTTSTSTTSPSSITTTTTAPVTYNASLSWTIPTTRTDGTPLAISELSGYEVYYTNDSGSVATTVKVAGGDTVNASLTSLASGSYSFAISAIDSNGLKSSLSTVASITFP